MVTRILIYGTLAVLLAMLALPWTSDLRIRAGKERAVEEGTELIASESHRDRERGLRRLVSLGESARTALEEALRSPDAEVRMRASAALRKADLARSDPDAVRLEQYRRILTIGLTKSGALEPGTVRFEALSLSPGLAARAAAGLAIEAEPDPLVHQRAVRFLRWIGRPEAASYLADALRRGWWLPSTLHQIAEGLIAAGDPSVVPAVRDALRSDDPRTRICAVRVLGRIGEAGDADLVRPLARDDEPDLRAQAARAIALLAGAGAIPDLVRLSADPDARVRAAAVDATAGLAVPAGRRLCLAALGDEDSAVRAAALRALRERGGPADAGVARALLGDPSPLVRGEAIRTLAALGQAEPAVLAGLTDPAPGVCREAILAARALPRDLRETLLAGMPPPADPFLRSLRDSVLSARRTN